MTPTDINIEKLRAAIRPLEWRPNIDQSRLYAAAFGIDSFYWIVGKPGAWSLWFAGSTSYVETPGYESQIAAKLAAGVDYDRRCVAQFDLSALSDEAAGEPVADNPRGASVRFAVPQGDTRAEMRSWLTDTPTGHSLYQHGDCLLVWANEGDLFAPAVPAVSGDVKAFVAKLRSTACRGHLALAWRIMDEAADVITAVCAERDRQYDENVHRIAEQARVEAERDAARAAPQAPAEAREVEAILAERDTLRDALQDLKDNMHSAVLVRNPVGIRVRAKVATALAQNGGRDHG